MILVGLFAFGWQETVASDFQWGDVETLFEWVGTPQNDATSDVLTQPVLVSDSLGRLHLFWGLNVAGESAIFYMQWDGRHWTEPIDVLIGPNERFNDQISAAIDKDGYIHIIWRNRHLYYSRVHVEQALDPRHWLHPIEVVPNVNTARLFVDEQNQVHVAYDTGADVARIFYTKCSDDQCTDWSSPTSIIVQQSGEAVRYPNLWVTSNGVIHLVWGQVLLPDGWPPVGVYYAQSEDGGATWSVPWQMGGDGYANPALASLSDDEIHLVSLGTLGYSRYYTRSLDGGKRWEPIQEMEPNNIGGANVGYVTLEVDSANNLHFFAVGTSGASNMYYSKWDGYRWSSLKPLEPGVSGAATVALGNHLNLVWSTGGGKIRHTSLNLSAPSLPPVEQPLPQVQPIATALPDTIEVATSSSPYAPSFDTTPDPLPPSHWRPLLLSIVVSLTVIFVVIAVKRTSTPGHK